MFESKANIQDIDIDYSEEKTLSFIHRSLPIEKCINELRQHFPKGRVGQ